MRVMRDCFTGKLDTQIERQRGAFARAFGDAEDQPIEQLRGPVDEVDMAIRDRVDRTGLDGDAVAGRAHVGSRKAAVPAASPAVYQRKRGRQPRMQVYRRPLRIAPQQRVTHLARPALAVQLPPRRYGPVRVRR
jgi:hypothetical protein